MDNRFVDSPGIQRCCPAGSGSGRWSCAPGGGSSLAGERPGARCWLTRAAGTSSTSIVAVAPRGPRSVPVRTPTDERCLTADHTNIINVLHPTWYLPLELYSTLLLSFIYASWTAQWMMNQRCGKTCFKVLSQHLPGGTDENHEKRHCRQHRLVWRRSDKHSIAAF